MKLGTQRHFSFNTEKSRGDKVSPGIVHAAFFLASILQSLPYHCPYYGH